MSLTQFRGELLATVRGTHDYQVKLWARGDRVLSSCTCPAWGEGWFCKHCVAVGLVAAKRLGAEPSLDEVERHLTTRDPAALASLARARATSAAEVQDAYRGAGAGRRGGGGGGGSAELAG